MEIRCKRIIGRYTGSEKGPLVIVFGGVHGNEHSGVKALKRFFTMLENEPLTNPEFVFKGQMLGIIGNCMAYEKGERFIDADLNRIWNKESIDRLKSQANGEGSVEEREMIEILRIVEKEISDYSPKKIVVLDLHTTSSSGGIFTIVPEDDESLELALEMYAPVIKGLTRGVKGSILHYFNTENMGIKTLAVSFESGQHFDKLSVDRAIAAITNCLRAVGCVLAEHVENRHNQLLIEYSRGLPRISEMIFKHQVKEEDRFHMLPEFQNFQNVSKGEKLASDKYGSIPAIEDSRILLPLYQKKGDDGFFLVREVD